MKNKIIILLSLLLLTGCTVNYNLEINKDTLNETITGTVTKEESSQDSNATGLSTIYSIINEEQKPIYNKEDDDVHDVRLIPAVLAFRETEQRPDALGEKRLGKDELADDGTHDEGHDHDGERGSLVDEGGAHAQRDHAEDEGKGFLDALRDEPGEEGSGKPADEKGATVCNRSDHDTSTC